MSRLSFRTVTTALLGLLVASACALPTDPQTVTEEIRESSTDSRNERVKAATDPSGAAGTTSGNRNFVQPIGAQGRTGVEKDNIKIGLVALLSGGLRSVGEFVLRPSLAYVETVNARGGINGRKLELVYYSGDVASEDRNLAAVKRLVEQDKVFAVVNTYSVLSQFGAAAAYLEEKGVPHIGGSSPNYTTDALAPQTFSFGPTNDVNGYFLANDIVRSLDERGLPRRVGMTWVNTPLYSTVAKFAEQRLQQLGVEITTKVTVASNADAIAGMDTVVAQLRSSGAQAVIAVNNANWTFGLIAAKRQGWHVPWVTWNAWAKLFLDNGGDALEGQISSSAGYDFTDRDTPQMRELRQGFARYYPEGPIDTATMPAWLHLSVLGDILSSLGDDITREAVIGRFSTLRDFDTGLTSRITIGPQNHLGMKETMGVMVKDQEWVRGGRLSRPRGLR